MRTKAFLLWMKGMLEVSSTLVSILHKVVGMFPFRLLPLAWSTVTVQLINYGFTIISCCQILYHKESSVNSVTLCKRGTHSKQLS